jgi:hypothetical protein
MRKAAKFRALAMAKRSNLSVSNNVRSTPSHDGPVVTDDVSVAVSASARGPIAEITPQLLQPQSGFWSSQEKKNLLASTPNRPANDFSSALL